MKDWLIEKTIPGLLNDRVLKPYGELTAFKFNSKERTAEAEMMLKGETHPVRLRIGRYELVSDSGRTFVIINDLTTSREWMTRLAQEFAVGKRFELPESVSKYAAMIA